MRTILTSFLLGLTLSVFSQQKMLQPAEMQGDLHILHDAWTSLHPGLYRFNTPAQIEADFKELRAQCAIDMPERRFYILLSQLAQKVKCGHTYLNPLNMDKETASRILPQKVIPLFFEIVGQKQMIVTQTLDSQAPFKPGDEIVAINRIPVRRVMDSLLSVSRSDGNHSLGKKYFNINETPDEANGYSLFDIYFPLFFPAPSAWNVTIQSYHNKTLHQYKIQPMGLDARLTAYKKQFGSVPTGEKSWVYRDINPQTAYMKFGTFAFWNSKFDEKRYVDSVFTDLNLHPQIKNIIIDIRNNEGGDNTGDYILSYITAKKLGCDDPDHPCYRFLTVPDTLLPYLSTWDNSFKAPKNPANFVKNSFGLYEQRTKPGCAHIDPQAKHFTGNVYLLINAKNSSAGYQMARNVKVNHLGTIIGETTGGSQQGINGGEFLFLSLPHSKFEIDLPLIYNYHPDKPDSGISPDFKVETTQRDIVENKDAQLLFALARIAFADR